jgi:hypothetical protein
MIVVYHLHNTCCENWWVGRSWSHVALSWQGGIHYSGPYEILQGDLAFALAGHMRGCSPRSKARILASTCCQVRNHFAYFRLFTTHTYMQLERCSPHQCLLASVWARGISQSSLKFLHPAPAYHTTSNPSSLSWWCVACQSDCSCCTSIGVGCPRRLVGDRSMSIICSPQQWPLVI